MFLTACGRCDGAIRGMSAQSADGPTIAPETAFRLTGDGPGDAEGLAEDAGISDETWFLVDDASGDRVPSTITADSGGHVCRNGVGFNLTPDEPLAAGDYTLVFLPEDIAWPYLGEDPAQWEGEPALVQHYTVN